MRHRARASVLLLAFVGTGACSGSGSKAPSCESICASAMACPNFDLNTTFGVPPGASSCADACANAHAIIDASHCQVQYDAVTRCAVMHNQCTDDLEVACRDVAGPFLACIQSGLGQDGGTPPDVGTTICNFLANVGQTVVKTATTDPYPNTDSFTGGAIADGTYVLTAMLNYATATAPAGTRKETLIFGGGTLQSVYSIDGAAEESYTASFTTPPASFGDIQIHLTCFASAPNTALNSETAYTATATELQILTDLMQASTYTKQ
jgi:hypothetical protein